MTPEPQLRLDSAGDGVFVASATGELDLATRPSFERALRESTPPETRVLVLDLTQVGFMDSACVQMLFALGAELAASRRRLMIVLAPSTPARRSIELADQGGLLSSYPSLAAALAACAEGDLARRDAAA